MRERGERRERERKSEREREREREIERVNTFKQFPLTGPFRISPSDVG